MGKCGKGRVVLTLREATTLGALLDKEMREKSNTLHREVEVMYDQREPAEEEERAEIFYKELVDLLHSSFTGVFRQVSYQEEPEAEGSEGEDEEQLAF